MKDFLQDLVDHTHKLTVLPLVKVTSTAQNATIESVAEDRTVMLYATTHAPVDGLGADLDNWLTQGKFGNSSLVAFE